MLTLTGAHTTADSPNSAPSAESLSGAQTKRNLRGGRNHTQIPRHSHLHFSLRPLLLASWQEHGQDPPVVRHSTVWKTFIITEAHSLASTSSSSSSDFVPQRLAAVALQKGHVDTFPALRTKLPLLCDISSFSAFLMS